MLTVKSGFILDIRRSNFGNLIGSEEKQYGCTNKFENSTHWGANTLNITNSIDTIYIPCDMISNYRVDENREMLFILLVLLI